MEQTLQSLPPELVGRIGQFLSQKDLGKLRMTSKEMKQKAEFPWARCLGYLPINFHPREFFRLLQLVQSEAPAKAISLLHIKKANPSAPGTATSTDYCCAAGHAQYILTHALKKMQNLGKVVVDSGKSTFDMRHITCDPQACPVTSGRHQVLPSIFQAIKDSGIQLPEFELLEQEKVARLGSECGSSPCSAVVPKLATEVLSATKELVFMIARSDTVPLHGEPHDSFAAEAQMVRAAPLLEHLAILNRSYGWSQGMLANTLPTAAYPSLRKVELGTDCIGMPQLRAFLNNNHQIKDLSIHRINLAGGSWLPILKLLRDDFSLQRFRFSCNKCNGIRVYSTWNGNYTTASDAALVTLPQVLLLGWPWDEPAQDWGLVLVHDDDGDLFETVVLEHGMWQALSFFIQGFYVTEMGGILNAVLDMIP